MKIINTISGYVAVAVIAIIVTLLLSGKVKADTDSFYVELEANNNKITGTNFKLSGTGSSAGYIVNSLIDLKIGYNKFGQDSGTVYVSVGSENVLASYKVEAKTISSGIKLKLPLSKFILLNTEGGIHSWSAKSSFIVIDNNAFVGGKRTNSGIDSYYGVGISTNFEHINFGLKKTIYNADEDQLVSDAAFVSLRFTF